MIHQSFNISLSSSSDISMGRACTSIVLGNHITIICPCVFEMNDQDRGIVGIISCSKDRWRASDSLDVQVQVFKNVGKHLIGNFALDEVSSIQIIQTVYSHHSLLLLQNSFSCQFFLVIAEIQIHILDLIDYIVASLKTLPFACTMNIEVFISNVFEASFLNQFLIIQGKIDLSIFLLAQQIDAEYLIIVSKQFLEMFLKGLEILFFGLVKLNFSIQTSLFPEARNRPSNLDVRIALSSKNYYLLCLTEISHIAFNVNSSGVISRSSFRPTPSRYQCIIHDCASFQCYLEVTNRPLNQPNKPPLIAQFLQILGDVFIPQELLL